MRLLLFVAIVSFSFGVQAQKKYLDKGFEQFEAGKYYATVTAFEAYFENRSEKDPLPKSALYTYAEALKGTSQYDKAAGAYHTLFKADTLQEYPLALLRMGQMYKQAGQYSLAKSVFVNAQEFFNSPDCALCQRLKQEVVSVEYAMQKKGNGIEKPKNNLGLNTPKNEFNARFFDDESLLFSRLTNKGESEQFQLFVSYESRGKQRVDSIIFREVNALGNVANASVSPDKKHVVFSYCPGNCQLWIADLVGGRFVRPRSIPGFSGAGVSYTHPSFHVINSETYLFFSSTDSTAGQGGYDLFWSQFKGDKFGEKKALAGVNTQGDEISPFVQNGILYFSSDYHPGFGGFDVFSSPFPASAATITNLGLPLNSPADDLYYNLNSKGTKYLLSSNRLGIKTSKTLNCCNDIFTGLSDVQPFQEQKQDTSYLPLLNAINAGFPFPLYFHNDEPDPKTTATVSSKPYSTSLKEYLDLDQKYSSNSPDGRAVMVGFFYERKKDLGRLDTLIMGIEGMLDFGQNVQLHIKGFASPLSNNGYNFTLTQRRVNSFKKELRYRGLGTAVDEGRIRLIFDPEGEETSPDHVSDDYGNTAYSVFSIDAMNERRIEVYKLTVGG